MADSVKIGLDLIVDGFNVALKSASTQSEVFQKKTISNFQAVQASFAVMAGSLAASAFEKLTSSIKDTFDNVINEAAASEDAINKLNIALRSAGLYSEKSSKSLQEYAADLQKITIYSDEQIMSSEALLLSLTNLSESGIKNATKTATNLAATLGIDLSEATDMVSKAINGNVMAFKKKGIEVQSAKTDAERLTNLMKALTSQEGAAEAATNSYAGALAKQRNQHSELSEAIGKLFTQNESIRNSMSALSETFSDLADYITNNTKLFNDLFTTAKIMVGGAAALAAGIVAVNFALEGMAIASALGVTAFQALGIAAGTAWAAITAPVTLAVAGIALVSVGLYQVVKHWDAIESAAYKALAASLEFASKGMAIFSDANAKSLRDEAQAWRDKATAIDNASRIAEVSAKLENGQSEVRQKRSQKELDDISRNNANRIELARINAESVQAIEDESNITQQENEVLHRQAMAEIDGTATTVTLAENLAAQEQLLLQRQEFEQKLLQLQIDAEINKANVESDAVKRTEALRDVANKASIDRERLNSKQSLDIQRLKNQDAQKLEKSALDNRKETLDLFATLQSSSNQTLVAIGKAAALTQLAIKTPEAVGSSFAYGSSIGGPPLGFAFGAVAATAMAAQAANVAGVKFADGGIVPGSDMTGDRIRASLNSGEMVLNKQQQSKLFAIANGQGSLAGGMTESKLDQMIASIQNLNSVIANLGTSVQIDGREIINVTRSQLNKGRSFA